MASSEQTTQNSKPETRDSLFLAFAAVTAEVSGWRKLTQLVTDHILGNKHFEVSLAVVNHERVSDELGDNRASTRPSCDWLFVASLVQSINLLVQLRVDERPFFK